MIVLYILLVLVILCFLLGHIRLGGSVRYSRDGPEVTARFGPIRLKLFPRGPKKKTGEKKPKKPKKPKKKKEKKPKEPKEPAPLPERIGGALEYAKALLPPVLDLVKRFPGMLRVDRLEMELTAGSPDPADAAMIYGAAQAALGALWYPITENLKVKDGHAWVKVDFNAGQMLLYLQAEITLRLGDLMRAGISFGIRALMAFFRVRNEHRNRSKQNRKAA